MGPPRDDEGFLDMADPLRIAIFARNEASNIEAAVRSVLACLDNDEVADARIHVLINGCTDTTAEVVRGLQQELPQVVPVELPFGDKCNAWNTYVHRLLDPGQPAHFFMDGDVRVTPGSIGVMQRVLDEQPRATAVAGFPHTGRNREKLSRQLVEFRNIFGNLYAARTDHLLRFRDLGLRLPLGACGNDHLITRLMKSDFDATGRLRHERVAYHADAGYNFRSLSPARLRDIRIYLKRRVTYALRHAQLVRIGELPVDRLPLTADETNRDIRDCLANGGHRELLFLERSILARRLRRMYPEADSDYFAQRLPLAA